MPKITASTFCPSRPGTFAYKATPIPWPSSDLAAVAVPAMCALCTQGLGIPLHAEKYQADFTLGKFFFPVSKSWWQIEAVGRRGSLSRRFLLPITWPKRLATQQAVIPFKGSSTLMC
ncbi:hypothetical protein LMH87_002955 [Akanthomyces muscarius]|uniref:Uncharacterized protein n=1 Tax=Akanthomyces muscarius TaxID=2231603 RepID=A0A9W8Q8R0_AKAMU|nr:hypothetical protein LMH87_002955 [Akanthomyces muscarius]KAJ4148489.1 hypothetical protein LMH87_002955 [Akanthomyces muscarius]